MIIINDSAVDDTIYLRLRYAPKGLIIIIYPSVKMSYFSERGEAESSSGEDGLWIVTVFV